MKFNSNVVCGMIFFLKCLPPCIWFSKAKLLILSLQTKEAVNCTKKTTKKKSQPNLDMTPLLKYIGKNIKGASL